MKIRKEKTEREKEATRKHDIYENQSGFWSTDILALKVCLIN